LHLDRRFLARFDPPSGVQLTFFGSLEVGSDDYPARGRS
jgi:hypothetical protein